MGADDVSRSDVERFVPVRQSTRDIDRRGLWWWPKPGLLKCSRRRHHHDCGRQRAPLRRASALACSWRRPVGSPFDPSSNTDQGV
ncbi:hypothetical protein QL285_009656 [Trifolium repens]|nr:hypothetical protein QL285_009656 [Trifolium repens]